jgi:DNA-binding NarL/FixJ family response regulator
VLILSMYSNTAFIAEVLKNGALGYVLKGCTEENLLRAVREVAAGRRFLSPAVSEGAIDAYIEQCKAGPFDPHETLTAREREVLQLAAEGKTTHEISERLHISPRTVENHRAHLMRKLGLLNQSELVRYALRRGLLPLEE